MLITLGLGSMFGSLEGLVTSLRDMPFFQKFRKELIIGKFKNYYPEVHNKKAYYQFFRITFNKSNLGDFQNGCVFRNCLVQKLSGNRVGSTMWKLCVLGVFQTFIFHHSDWIRRFRVNLRVESKCLKIWIGITMNTDTFYKLLSLCY